MRHFFGSLIFVPGLSPRGSIVGLSSSSSLTRFFEPRATAAMPSKVSPFASVLTPGTAEVSFAFAGVEPGGPEPGAAAGCDRAAFHFLTDEKDRAAYIERLARRLKAGGHAIIATFALDGPEKCSGLPVARYDSASLGQALGTAFKLVHTQRHEHVTPWESRQIFQFSIFRREG